MRFVPPVFKSGRSVFPAALCYPARMRSRQAWSVLALMLLLPLGCSTPEPGLPFIEDDYAGALAEARERGTPLFIESWAPW